MLEDAQRHVPSIVLAAAGLSVNPTEDDDPGLDEILRMRPGKERNERLREWATKAKNGPETPDS